MTYLNKYLGICTGLVALSVSMNTQAHQCELSAYEFFWKGQVAGFMVKGRFSFDSQHIPDNGIVREENLLALDVSFYDPKGRHLRTYTDNHLQPVDAHGNPYLNFAFDTLSGQILQDGTWKVDDNANRFRNGFMMGEGNPDLRKETSAQTGLAFWSRPADSKVPHLHVDDWADDFVDPDTQKAYPTAFSSHEDVAFPYQTTKQLLDKPGKIKIDQLASAHGAFGQTIVIRPISDRALDKRGLKRCKAAS